MTPVVRGLVIAAVQVALVGSVGVKLLYDRTTLPRVWAETVGFDPVMPIRGRYVQLRLVVDVPGEAAGRGQDSHRLLSVRLAATGGRLTGTPVNEAAIASAAESGAHPLMEQTTAAGARWVLIEPVAYFLPEAAADPTRPRPAGETLWVEVTVPRTGPPRPIRLGIGKGGRITPLPQ